jgi:hypothetical protein
MDLYPPTNSQTFYADPKLSEGFGLLAERHVSWEAEYKPETGHHQSTIYVNCSFNDDDARLDQMKFTRATKTIPILLKELGIGFSFHHEPVTIRNPYYRDDLPCMQLGIYATDDEILSGKSLIPTLIAAVEEAKLIDIITQGIPVARMTGAMDFKCSPEKPLLFVGDYSEPKLQAAPRNLQHVIGDFNAPYTLMINAKNLHDFEHHQTIGAHVSGDIIASRAANLGITCQTARMYYNGQPMQNENFVLTIKDETSQSRLMELCAAQQERSRQR